MKTEELKILIIDDEQIITSSLEIILSMEGFQEIDTCNDSREVINMLNTKRYNLVIMDLNMPYISGYELFETISNQFEKLPIIILSADYISEAVGWIKNNAYDFIEKPVEGVNVIRSINQYLNASNKFEQTNF